MNLNKLNKCIPSGQKRMKAQDIHGLRVNIQWISNTSSLQTRTQPIKFDAWHCTSVKRGLRHYIHWVCNCISIKPLIMVLYCPVALSSAHQLSSTNILLSKFILFVVFYLLTQKVKVYSCGSTAPPASDNDNVFPPCSIQCYFAKQNITIALT